MRFFKKNQREDATEPPAASSLDDRSSSSGDNNVVNEVQKRSAKEVATSLIDPGVARIEAINRILTRWDRGFLCVWILLCAYSYNLDLNTRSTYQVYAANAFGNHSLQSTVNVARGASSAAAQLLSARMSDIFGRVEIIIVALVFYVVGTAIEAASDDIATFTGGSVMWSIGRTVLQLAMEVLVGDISNLRWRLLFAFVPTWPTLVNTWISGNVVQSVLNVTGWYWGVGMWCIIMPVMATPLICHLIWVQIRARKMGRIQSYGSYYSVFRKKRILGDLFWILDIVGIFFMLVALCCLLIPLTLAGGERQDWKTARILAPLCIGVVFIPIFCIWEWLYAPHPLVPVKKLKSRGVWPGLALGFFLDLSYSMQSDYLLSVLMVAFGFTQTMATRITGLYLFCAFSLGTILSFFIFYLRRLKIFPVIGTAVYIASYGILIHYRGSPDGKGGIIGGEIMMGFGTSGITYPVQSLMQSWVPHELLATVTGLNWAIFQIGTSVGGSVSGAMWTQILPRELNRRLSPELANHAYSSPLTFIKKYPFGTPERDAIMHAYQHIQWLLCIAGMCMAVPMFFCALTIRRAILTTGHSLVTRDMKLREVGETDSLAGSDTRSSVNEKDGGVVVAGKSGNVDDESLHDYTNKRSTDNSPPDEIPHHNHHVPVEAAEVAIAIAATSDAEAQNQSKHFPEDKISIRAKTSKWWRLLDFII